MQTTANAEEANRAITPAQTSCNRLARLDSFRVIAAVAVIWIHVARSPEMSWTTIFCRFAVPFFIAGVAYFALHSGLKSKNQYGHYIVTRSIKLYLPFLFWAAVYCAFKLMKQVVVPEQESDLAGIDILWSGGAYHLWFIPFALFVSIAAFGVGKSVRRLSDSHQALVACGFIVVASVFANSSIPTCRWAGKPFCYMLDASPAAILGMSTAMLWQVRDRLWFFNGSRSGASLAGVTLGLSLFLLALYGRNIALESIAGCACLAVALTDRAWGWEARIAPLGQYALGIYFVHLLFVKILESVEVVLHIELSWKLDFCVLASTVIASGLAVWLLSKHKWTSWTVA